MVGLKDFSKINKRHIKDLLDKGKYMHLADLVSTVDKNKKVTCCIYWLDRVLY